MIGIEWHEYATATAKAGDLRDMCKLPPCILSYARRVPTCMDMGMSRIRDDGRNRV